MKTAAPTQEAAAREHRWLQACGAWCAWATAARGSLGRPGGSQGRNSSESYTLDAPSETRR